MPRERNIESVIEQALGSLGERPTTEQCAKAQTELLAAILRELSDLKAAVTKLADNDDSDRDDREDDDRDKNDDDRDDEDDDDDDDDEPEDRSQNRRSRGGRGDD
jgi:hypothetical protein